MINTGLEAGVERVRGTKPFQRLRFTVTSPAVETAGDPLSFDPHRLKAGVNENFRR